MEEEKNIQISLKCIYCGKNFPDLLSFKNHLKKSNIIHHKSSRYFKVYSCMICKNSSTAIRNINFHKNSCEINLKLKKKMTNTEVEIAQGPVPKPEMPKTSQLIWKNKRWINVTSKLPESTVELEDKDGKSEKNSILKHEIPKKCLQLFWMLGMWGHPQKE